MSEIHSLKHFTLDSNVIRLSRGCCLWKGRPEVKPICAVASRGFSYLLDDIKNAFHDAREVDLPINAFTLYHHETGKQTKLASDKDLAIYLRSPTRSDLFLWTELESPPPSPPSQPPPPKSASSVVSQKTKNVVWERDNNRCCITGEVVSADGKVCHIVPKYLADDKNVLLTSGISYGNELSNLILLKSDIHDCYDEHEITIDAQMIIHLHTESMRKRYQILDNQPILRPNQERDNEHGYAVEIQPKREFSEYFERVFPKSQAFSWRNSKLGSIESKREIIEVYYITKKDIEAVETTYIQAAIKEHGRDYIINKKQLK